MSLTSSQTNAVIGDRENLAAALESAEYIAVLRASYGCPRPVLITHASDQGDAMGQAGNACHPWEIISALYRVGKVFPKEAEASATGA